MRRPGWTAQDVGDVSAATVLITGGNSGIGLEAGRILAGHGAQVILGCRNLEKGAAAVADITRDHPEAHVKVLELDLADLSSVEHASDRFLGEHDRLDVLCNNAGVMALPYRQTIDGFEMQFGTNHLGHFALTGRLLPGLLAAPAPRVVTVSSTAHRIGRIELDNLDGSRRYEKWRAYGMSKLANLLFTLELQRRAREAGSTLLAAAAHPGYTTTNLQTAGPRMAGSRVRELASSAANFLVGQKPAMGALPTVYAAVAPDVRGGDFIGPRGPGEIRGYPVKVTPTRAARDPELAAQLWEASESLTGVSFVFSASKQE